MVQTFAKIHDPECKTKGAVFDAWVIHAVRLMLGQEALNTQHSKLTISRGSRKGQHITDVFHAGDEHQHALKAHPEARMWAAAVFAQVKIPAVVLEA